MDKEKPYYKLTELKRDGLTYNKLWRSVETLREAGVIRTFTGARGAICLTLDEKLVLDKFLTYLDRCKGSQKEALYLLRLELLERRVEQLQEENRRLHALVEVRPPWWVRLMRWLLGMPFLVRLSALGRSRPAQSASHNLGIHTGLSSPQGAKLHRGRGDNSRSSWPRKREEKLLPGKGPRPVPQAPGRASAHSRGMLGS